MHILLCVPDKAVKLKKQVTRFSDQKKMNEVPGYLTLYLISAQIVS